MVKWTLIPLEKHTQILTVYIVSAHILININLSAPVHGSCKDVRRLIYLRNTHTPVVRAIGVVSHTASKHECRRNRPWCAAELHFFPDIYLPEGGGYKPCITRDRSRIMKVFQTQVSTKSSVVQLVYMYMYFTLYYEALHLTIPLYLANTTRRKIKVRPVKKKRNIALYSQIDARQATTFRQSCLWD